MYYSLFCFIPLMTGSTFTSKDLRLSSHSVIPQLSSYVDEFSKADIQIKAVVLNKNSSPTQATSFPAFKWVDLCEEDWEISDLKNLFETTKFLFVFFQEIDNKIILKKPVLWNMSDADVNKAKVVWEYTRNIVNQGNIVKGYKTTYIISL